MNKSSTTPRSETKGLAQKPLVVKGSTKEVKQVAKNSARSAVKQLQAAKAPAPPKGQATKQIARALTTARPAVEWRTEHHGVPVIGGDGLREGHAETRAMGEDLFIRGTERLGPVGVNGVALKAGDVMNVIELNPASFGVRITLLSLPYAKFEFTRVKLRYVGLISEANAAANGGLFIGFNVDPDSPIPVGNNGLDAISTWGKNVTVVPVFNSTSELTLDLQARRSTEPLFVDTTGDVRFSTQGQMMILAGQDFPAESQNFGQWFIEYEVRLYEINQPSALMNCLTGAGVCNGGDTGNSLIPLPGSESGTGLLRWTGDTSLTTAIAAGTFGGNLQLTRQGLYLFEMTTLTTAIMMPMTATADLACISGCFFPTNAGGGATAQTFLSNIASATTAGNPANKIVDNISVGGQGYAGLNGSVQSDGVGDGWETFNVLVQADAGAIVNLTTSKGTGTNNNQTWLTISRVSPNITDQLVTRRAPQQIDAAGNEVLSARQNRMLRAAPLARDIDIAARLKFTEFCASVKDGEPDALYANVLIKCFQLCVAPRKLGPSALHPALSVLLWLARTFGPAIAASMLGVAQEKLKGWMEGEKKKPIKKKTSALVDDDDFTMLTL